MYPSPPEIDPLELLSRKIERKATFLSSVYNPAYLAIFGLGMASFMNWAYRKPPLSGIQRHIAFASIGIGFGYYFDQRRIAALAKRDAILRHYVELHPEDFPKRARQKYADILQRWIPIR